MLRNKSRVTLRFKSSIIDFILNIFFTKPTNLFTNCSFFWVSWNSVSSRTTSLWNVFTFEIFWDSNLFILFFNFNSNSFFSFSILLLSSDWVSISFNFSSYSFNCIFILFSISFFSWLYLVSKLCFNIS